MDKIINPKLYDEIINSDVFLNDLWAKFGATDKASILEKAGYNLEKEYALWNEEFNANNQQLPL